MDFSTSRSKWNSQQIQKQCKNNRHNDFSTAWSKYSNSNASTSWTNFCNEYHKDMYTKYSNDDDIEIVDEYERNLHEPHYWRCNVCTYDNIDRDLYCSICESPFQPPSYDTNTSHYADPTLSDYMPSQLTDRMHKEDDFDESVQIAIILSYDTTQTDSDDSDEYVYSDGAFADNTPPRVRKRYTKPLLNGYKLIKGKSKKQFSLKAEDGSAVSFRNRKQWQSYKRKQKQRNAKENKEIKRNHRKCINACPKLINLIKQNTVKHIKQQISSSYDNSRHFNMKCVLNYNVLRRFVDAGVKEPFGIVYHGTNYVNNSSIIDNGLIVGGTKGVAVRHGCAYGRGVYCSPDTSTARCYEGGSMFVCVVKNKKVKRYRSIWVVPSDTSILPLFLASFEENTRGSVVQNANNNVSKSNDGLSQKVMKFIPSFTSLNKKKTKVRRKWNAYLQ